MWQLCAGAGCSGWGPKLSAEAECPRLCAGGCVPKLCARLSAPLTNSSYVPRLCAEAMCKLCVTTK